MCEQIILPQTALRAIQSSIHFKPEAQRWTKNTSYFWYFDIFALLYCFVLFCFLLVTPTLLDQCVQCGTVNRNYECSASFEVVTWMWENVSSCCFWCSLAKPDLALSPHFIVHSKLSWFCWYSFFLSWGGLHLHFSDFAISCFIILS